MAKDMLHAITDAETEIEARMRLRYGESGEIRTVVAAETIADELTRLRAEVKTLRYLFAAAQGQQAFRS